MTIKVKKMHAGNVVQGVQVKGGTATEAEALGRLLGKFKAGDFEIDELFSGDVVAGFQFISSPESADASSMREEIAFLRAELAKDESGISEIKAAETALATAEQELANTKPDPKRLEKALGTAATTLTKAAEAAEAAGKLGSTLGRWAVAAAGLGKIAGNFFGG